MQVGQVIFIKNFLLKSINANANNSMEVPFEIVIDEESTITLTTAEKNFAPLSEVQFTKIKDLGKIKTEGAIIHMKGKFETIFEEKDSPKKQRR